MKPKMIVKTGVDIGMTIVLLLMPYELVGQVAHEWLGIIIFVLFIAHHILNGNWSRNLLKGKYTPLRIWQAILVLLVLAAMVGSMVSGIILSRHVLSFLPIDGGRSFARKLHMIAAYWGFALMSLHLGLHWGMIMGMAGKAFQTPSAARRWVGRLLAFVVAGYGVYAFGKRGFGNYMLLRNQFVFFDFEEPLLFFFLDYIAIMGLFIFIGNYICAGLKYISRKQKKAERSK